MGLLLEMTDTFQGETNYNWVKRIENFQLPENCTYKQKIIEIKKALEIEGVRIRKTCDTGDFEAWDIKGACVRIMLITLY